MEYHISQLDADANTGVLLNAYWMLQHTDSGHSGFRSGVVYFATDPSAPNPTTYANLEESQVLEWVQAVLGPTYMASLEAGILDEVERKKASAPITGIPWGTPPVPPAPPPPVPAPPPAPV